MAHRLLAVSLDPRHLQDGVDALGPYLPHEAPFPTVLPGEDDDDVGRKRVVFHPRVRSPGDLPEPLQRMVTERFEGRFGSHDVEVSDAAWRRLHVVQFASRSKEVTPLAVGLPRSWRRDLSNFATRQPLRIDDRTWASVEHYFQGRKAECSNLPQMAEWFTREYEGPERVGDDPRDAKRAGARKGYTEHGATLETARWIEVREQVMRAAVEARWEQDDLFRRILVSTRGLQLLHFERSGARSFWGGSLDKQTGRIKGTNRLGTLMMERRDHPA